MRRVTMILADTPRRTQPTSRLRHRVAVSLSGGGIEQTGGPPKEDMQCRLRERRSSTSPSGPLFDSRTGRAACRAQLLRLFHRGAVSTKRTS
jgi:hypothetical protein